MQSLNIFMHELLDYAGLFPPALLSLEESLENFVLYHEHKQKKWLGKFILPANKINDSILILNKQNSFLTLNKKAEFSIILSSCETISEYSKTLSLDFTVLLNLLKHYSKNIEIKSFEFLPPKEIFYSKKYDGLNYILTHFYSFLDNAKLKAEVFIEITLSEDIESIVNIIKNYENKFNKKISIKMRTGGISPEQIPSSYEIANAISTYAASKTPLKATAGLHVPIPNFNNHVGTTLHGFLNVFSCMLLCYDQNLSVSIMEKLLLECKYINFKFTEKGLFVNNYFLDNKKILYLRQNYIKSFGTCSFIEPIEHLEKNNFIK